ncbi:hypothetical protein LQF12_01015 [Ruania suaedae]|uniref:hypothetical protein n=1 Tax=Ruania suaedae TaxID=2897774 RepID=UPI001E4427BE|nr:hypothetical protein [Ruania suaedae]UFU03224.1 hypothetical protein LQF12_01015 [Ruania suaedae]
MRRLSAVVLPGVLVTSLLAAGPVAGAAAAPGVVDPLDLALSGPDQQRSMSVPESRLVLNPQNFYLPESEVEQSTGPSMPLGAGYYANDEAVTMPAFFELFEGVAGEPPLSADDPSGIEVGFADEFEEFSDEWVPEPGLDVSIVDGVAHLSVLPDSPVPWPAMAREVTVDMDLTPVLRVALPSVSGQWALKLNDGADVDIEVQPGSSAGGVHSFDLASITGWSGEQTFTIKMFAVGGDAQIQMDSLRLQGQQAGFVDNFTSETLEWDVGAGMGAEVADGALTLSVLAENQYGYGAIQRGVDVDLDEFPVLRLALPSTSGDWALKVSAGGGADIDLEPGSNESGVHSFDVAAATGWSGSTSFTIKLFAVGGGAQVVVDSVRMVSAAQGQQWVHGAEEFENFWSPASLDFTATYPGGTLVQGADTMVGHDAIVREIDIERDAAVDDVLRVAGSFVGEVGVDTDAGVLTVEGEYFTYAVAGLADVFFFESREEMLAGGPASSEPTSRMGVWAAAVPTSATQVRIGAGFSVDDGNEAAARAVMAAGTPVADARADLIDFWTGALAGVPHPRDFSLLGVSDDRGLTDEQVRSAYYRAFVALYSNVLPPQPETGYGYRTVATGKPSMWNHGADGARSAAAWESFIGVQLLAYIDPEAAWDSFNGLMSLVDEEGTLGGESLPSRKAQAAWVLYAMTGDQEQLATSYDALIRLLQWQAENPRWIYGAYDHPGERDSEFVTSLIVDVDFGIQIAEVLDHSDDIPMLQDLREELLTGYQDDFWAAPGEHPARWYIPGDPQCTILGSCFGDELHDLQTLSSMHLDGLDDERRATLESFFDSVYRPQAQLAGFAGVKYTSLSFTAYALFDHGRGEAAQTLTSTLLRDIVASGSFAEAYNLSDDGPVPMGVRPSIFGLASVIDAVWLNNGYRMDLGEPHALLAPGVDGGLTGISYRGQELNVAADAAAQDVVFSGAAVAATAGCNTITDVQISETVALPTACEGDTDPDPTNPTNPADPTDPDPTDPGTGPAPEEDVSEPPAPGADGDRDGLADTGVSGVHLILVALSALLLGVLVLLARHRALAARR